MVNGAWSVGLPFPLHLAYSSSLTFCAGKSNDDKIGQVLVFCTRLCLGQTTGFTCCWA